MRPKINPAVAVIVVVANTATNRQIAESIGYSNQEIKSASDANLGLGCGNPTGMGEIREGDVVLDLGSGGGV